MISDILTFIRNVLTDGVVLLVLLVCLAVLCLASNGSRTYTYFVDDTYNADFAAQSSRILRDSVINDTHNIREVLDKNSADIEIYLVPRDEMMKKRGTKPLEMYPGTNKPIYFSWTYQQPKPTIYIDEINWLYGVEESGLSLADYRTYVIQHEFMHALGFDHQECNERTAPGGVCPIMYQSTRGCPKGYKCGYKVTKFDYEKRIQ